MDVTYAGSTRADTLKVDQACMPIGNAGDVAFVCNINVPGRYLDTQEMPDIIRRIRDFIIEEYSNVENVSFQVCAAYNLVHSLSGALRYFHGSFMPGASKSNVISPFRQFGPDFEAHMTGICHRDIIEFTLRNVNLETNYVFDSLVSIIVSVQAKVKSTHNKLLQRGFSHQVGQTTRKSNNVRIRRFQKTFLLP